MILFLCCLDDTTEWLSGWHHWVVDWTLNSTQSLRLQPFIHICPSYSCLVLWYKNLKFLQPWNRTRRLRSALRQRTRSSLVIWWTSQTQTRRWKYCRGQALSLNLEVQCNKSFVTASSSINIRYESAAQLPDGIFKTKKSEKISVEKTMKYLKKVCLKLDDMDVLC